MIIMTKRNEINELLCARAVLFVFPCVACICTAQHGTYVMNRDGFGIYDYAAGIEIFPYILSGRFDYILIRDTQVHMWSGRTGAHGLLCECVCERAIYGNIQSADI